MDKAKFTKMPIDQYLKPIDFNTALSTEHFVIDREGNFHMIELKTVRMLNGSEHNAHTEHFGEKVTFINDYIYVSVTDTFVDIDIASDMKPTETQLAQMLEFIKAYHKNHPEMPYDLNWRWTPGGGCTMVARTKLPGLIKKRLETELKNHDFRDYHNIYVGFEIVE